MTASHLDDLVVRTKFMFDEDFAVDHAAKPPEPTILLSAHLEAVAQAEAAARRDGFAAAEQKAVAEAERRTAQAFERIAAGLDGMARELRAIEARIEAEAVEVAVAVASKLAPELVAREPFAEIAALAADCFRHLVAAPHVVVRVDEAIHQTARERLDEIAGAHGFAGRLVVLAEPGVAPGDCRIEWADGGMVRDRAATEAAIAEAVGRYVTQRRGG